MTNPLTPAQQAQQSNRTGDGKYTTKNYSEADVGLSLSLVSDRREQLEALYSALAQDGITQMQVSSDDDQNYYVTSVTPDDFNAFDAATDHLSGTDLRWDELCIEDGGWAHGQSTVTLDVEDKMQQVNERKFTRLRNKPTTDDIDLGYDAALQQMRAERHHLTRDDTVDEAQLRQSVDGHTRYSAIKKRVAKDAARKAAYGRAYEQGVAIDPQDDAHFEQIWSGELKEHQDHIDHTVGVSQQDVAKLLETSRKDRQWVQEGALSPRELLGGGTKQEALDAIDVQIQTYQRGLHTRGRSLGVNVEAMEQMR